MVRVGLLEHLVEDDPLQGASRLLALDNSNEVLVEGLPIDLPCLLLLVVLFGPPARALVIVCWCLPLVVLVVDESTDCLLANGVLCHYIHQLVNGLWTISA